jgi:hypothetical protein
VDFQERRKAEEVIADLLQSSTLALMVEGLDALSLVLERLARAWIDEVCISAVLALVLAGEC